MGASPTANGSLFDFGGGVNKNPAGGAGTTNMTGSTFPVPHSQTSGGGVYGANGYNTGGANNGLPGSPFPQLPNNAFNQLYGGLGPFLSQFINGGAGYSPQVLQTLINQIQPQVNRGIATLESTAGTTGNRYGSAYQVGAADYLSQVNQNELSMASGLYENSVQNTLGLLSNIYPLQAQYHNNQGGFLSSLLSSLIPTAGGVLGDIFGHGGSGGSGGGGGIGGILGTIFGHGSGGSGGATGGMTGGSGPFQYPIPGTNENWGGTYNPNGSNNPPAGGNTGVPGGQISGEAGNAFLNNLLKYFNPVAGQPLGIAPDTLSYLAGGPSSVPLETQNQTGSIPLLPSGGGSGTEATTYDFFDTLEL